ncbi:37S ribosomal protein S5 [Colletotrichum sp. SAR11_239]|nr:37S ribosomal protein S5 [Colletotrichum sp. SAR11_239]
MNAVRPARSVLSRCTSTSTTAAPAVLPARLFHSSSNKSSRRRSRFRNITAEKMGVTSDPEKLDKLVKQYLPAYTPEEKEMLRKQYTPEQMEALEAAEEAIDPKDLLLQGRLRTDPYRQNYIEDFSKIQPVIDLKPQKPVQPREVEWLPRREWVDNHVEKLANRVEVELKDSMGKAYARALRNIKKQNPMVLDFTEEELKELEENPELRKKFLVEEDVDVLGKKESRPADQSLGREWLEKIDEEFMKALEQEFNTNDDNIDILQGSKLDSWKAADGPDGNSAVQPPLGKIPGVKGLYTPEDAEDDELDGTGEFTKIKAATGMRIADIQTIITKPLVMRWVHNQTRLGKIRSISIIVAAGNGNGRLGLGEAKSTDLDVARTTAKMLAIRNMKPIRRYEDRTIYGEVQKKISGTVVKIQSRPPGFGLRVSHRIFEMARLAGIHDLAAKIMRSKNPYNTVKVVYECLLNQPDPEQIAIGRGKKLVDARKVYYGGNVY